MWWNKRIVHALYIILGIIIIAFPLAAVFNILSAKEVAHIFIGEIGVLFGLNPYITKALVVAATLPLLWLFVQSFNILDSRRRTISRFALAGALVAYYIILAIGSDPLWFDKDGKPLKCYIRTDKKVIVRRIEYLPSSGIDRETGRKCIPVTKENLRDLEIIKRVLRGGGVKEIKRPEKFFSDQTGEPIIWFVRRPSGEYTFFNAPVYDPVTGERAVSITKRAIEEYRRWERAKKEKERERAIKEEEERKRKERAALAEKARKKRQEEIKKELIRLEKMKKMLSIRGGGSNNIGNVGVHIIASAKDKLESEVLAKLKYDLSSRGVEVDIWMPSFVKEGYFDRVVNGDLEPAKETGVFQSLQKVLVGRLHVRCRYISSALIGMDGRKCAVRVEGRLISGHMARKIELLSTGFGVSEGQAAKKAAGGVLQLMVREMKK